MAKVMVADQILKKQDEGGMLRRALERIIQLYTDRSHFVYELLQNAEDAGATKIKFEQKQNELVVQHNGRPFTMANLQGLCDIGMSDKTDDLNQIGEFGVGFKSVFSICEKVQLYSHPSEEDQEKGYPQFDIEIQNFVQPVDIKEGKVEKGYTTKFVFPYAIGFTFSGYDTFDKLNKAVSDRLQNLGITTLLFMKHLQSIDYSIELPDLKKSGTYRLNKKKVNDHCKFISALGESGKSKSIEEVSFLVYSRPVKEMAGKSIDIAFAMSRQKNGEYTFVQAPSRYISVYFPTETISGLNFIVQGPYRTTPNRSSVPQDDYDNLKLAEQTAELLRSSILELRDKRYLTYDFLSLLPFSSSDYYRASLFSDLYSEVREMFYKEKIIISKEGTYISGDCALIARSVQLTHVFTDQRMTELIDNGKEYHWLPEFIRDNKGYRALYQFFRDDLKIEELRPENMGKFFNNNPYFLLSRDDDWLVDFYTLYNSVPGAFSKGNDGSMLTVPIVKTSLGTFEPPYIKRTGKNQEDKNLYWDDNSVYQPNVFLPAKDAEDIEGIFYVDDNMLKRCSAFFINTLGLRQPSSYEPFKQDFIERCLNGEKISDEQHIKDLRKLLSFREKEEYFEDVSDLIRTYLRLKCVKKGKKIYVNPNQKEVLFTVTSDGMNIEGYYEGIEDPPYIIDQDFYEKNKISRETLKSLGVTEDIAVGLDETEGEFENGDEWYTYSSNFRWNLNLDRLDEVLLYISKHPDDSNSMIKSNFIFRFLQDHEDMLTGRVYSGYNGIYDSVSDIISQLNKDGEIRKEYSETNWNGKWLYTQAQRLVSPQEINKNDLSSILYGSVKPGSKLYELLKFKKSSKDYLEEAEKEYDKLDEKTKDQFFEIALMREFGCSKDEVREMMGRRRRKEGTSVNKEGYEMVDFPSAKVKSWASLRKHATEEFAFAAPVEYQSKLRSVRTTRASSISSTKAYLKGMYCIEDSGKAVCQMCQDKISEFTMPQISPSMKEELDPMYLCLCNNCAAKYKRMRSDKYAYDKFKKAILDLTDNEIDNNDPVKINFADEEIWFTQAHIAEIRELMTLQESFEEDSSYSNESLKEQSSKGKTQGSMSLDDNEIVQAETNDYEKYIGKRVEHNPLNGNSLGRGIIEKCDSNYITVRFESGKRAGENVKFQFSAIANNLLRIL